jgi:anthranilate/para-aminobenzoate synthase component I
VVIKEVSGRSDPLAVARCLAGRPGLAVLCGDDGSSFVASDPVEVTDDLLPASGPRCAGWAGLPAAPRWIGVIPYEHLRSIERPAWVPREAREPPSIVRPRWMRYDAVLRVTAGQVVIEADDAEAAARLEARLRNVQPARDFTLRLAPPIEPARAHVARVEEVLELIRKGDVYQVNLARPIDYELRGDALSLFTSLLRSTYGMFADLGEVKVLCSSPELALEVRGDRMRTIPIKGTRPRGADARHDEALARELDVDPKEHAELTMAVDLHRNDLGKVAEPGSVRVLGAPRLLRSRTVWSRAAEVVARRAPGVSDEAIVRALLPCGSVTGAPKIRAMEIIATLEPARRGLYTGALGYVGRDGAIVLAMAIRTLVAEGSRARYFSGGGIVADSMPERELEETRWKAAHLAKLGRTWSAALAKESRASRP